MNALTVPDTKVIDQKIGDAKSEAEALIVSDDAGYRRAGAFVQIVKDLQKEVDKTFDDSIEAAHKAHKAILSAKSLHAQPLKDAEAITKQKMVAYYNEQERKRLAEQARIDEERRKAEAEARRIEAENERLSREAAAANRPPPTPAAPPPPPPPVRQAPAAPIAKGISVKTVWKHEVIDLMELVRAVAAGKVDLKFLLANDSDLRGEAVRTQGAANLPGIHFYAEKGVSAR